ncbi:MAG: hypothetical protein ACQER9_03680 [Nanobdellota archaeon]
MNIVKTKIRRKPIFGPNLPKIVKKRDIMKPIKEKAVKNPFKGVLIIIWILFSTYIKFS